jgi:hypothetical protein
MTADWAPLDTELAAWDQAGLSLPLWWRDDDAIEPTAALNQLSDMADRLGLLVHLAIIPAFVQDALVDAVSDHPLIPVVHGWSHQNRAPAGQKKAEYPDNRPLADMTVEVAKSRATLTDIFGDALCPMFVPPWNRITPDLIAALPMAGYKTLSTFTPRKTPTTARDLVQVNTHLDPISWRGGKSLIAPAALINQVARQLSDRRTGIADNDEPYGILTHHLVHDTAIWEFTEVLISRLLRGPAIPWTALNKDTLHEPT